MNSTRLGPAAVIRCVLVVTAALAAVLLAGPAAYAHASLVASDPPDGATIAKEPSQVSFEFNQNIGNPAYVTVKAPDGSRVDSGDPKVVDDTVTQQVEHTGLAGEYTMSYRVVSADGHPVEGTVTYTVESGREGATPSPSTPSKSGSQTFVQQHSTHLLWGLGGVVIAAVLLLWPRKRRHD